MKDPSRRHARKPLPTWTDPPIVHLSALGSPRGTGVLPPLPNGVGATARIHPFTAGSGPPSGHESGGKGGQDPEGSD